jgi:hypothetical protein
MANVFAASMPDILTMKNGSRVTTAEQWPARRAEILEDFEREVYGRIPANVPSVTWEVTAEITGNSGGIPTVTRTLIGHVDNSAYPQITVNIQARYTVPANSPGPVPLMIEIGNLGFGAGNGSRAAAGGTKTQQAIANGWGFGSISATSIQADSYQANAGIINLTSQGQPRRPDEWGAIRAWQWGVSRMIDYLETHADTGVDAKNVAVAGISIYGKAALVAQAFEPRVVAGFIGSSGEGGSKLHRRVYGETVENLTRDQHYWMAGNFIKYGASDPLRTAADLPVDSHQLIALCAPRPCFISHGSIGGGEANWVDTRGSYMAGVLAGPVYRLLGRRGFGDARNYLTEELPPANALVGGELAWRQHGGGHDLTPNWPAFYAWVAQYPGDSKSTAPAAPVN